MKEYGLWSPTSSNAYKFASESNHSGSKILGMTTVSDARLEIRVVFPSPVRAGEALPASHAAGRG